MIPSLNKTREQWLFLKLGAKKVARFHGCLLIPAGYHVLISECMGCSYRTRKVRIPLNIKRRLERLEKRESDLARGSEQEHEPEPDPAMPDVLRELSQGVGDVSMDEVRDLIDALF